MAGSYRIQRRMDNAGLTKAIAEVLSLEQGDTDKLCEYSPKTLLELVFQVFGDKQVLMLIWKPRDNSTRPNVNYRK